MIVQVYTTIRIMITLKVFYHGTIEHESEPKEKQYGHIVTVIFRYRKSLHSLTTAVKLTNKIE